MPRNYLLFLFCKIISPKILLTYKLFYNQRLHQLIKQNGKNPFNLARTITKIYLSRYLYLTFIYKFTIYLNYYTISLIFIYIHLIISMMPKFNIVQFFYLKIFKKLYGDYRSHAPIEYRWSTTVHWPFKELCMFICSFFPYIIYYCFSSYVVNLTNI